MLIFCLDPVAPAGAETNLTESAQKVLYQRVHAVVTGNKDEFLATMDPQASSSFKDAQAKVFDGMRSLPLVDYQLTIDAHSDKDLSPALAITKLRHSQAAFLPETHETYMLSSYDDRPAINIYWIRTWNATTFGT